MATRKRDAKRRQVSLAVETLEDRFLLSGDASLSFPTATSGHSVPFAVVPNSMANNETKYISLQQGLPSAAQYITHFGDKGTMSTNYHTIIPNPLVYPPMGLRLDEDGDGDDPPGRMDGDASRNNALEFLPTIFNCSDAAGCPSFALPPQSPVQMTLAAANGMSLLPLLSAAGLGVGKTVPLTLLSPAATLSGNAPGNPGPPSRKDEMQPMPAHPEVRPSALPPLAEEPAEPPPLSKPSGPLVELLPIDVEALQRGVDAFFQQLGDLSEEWPGGRLLEKLAPWLLAVSVAGYGWIRFQDRRERSLAELFGSDRSETVPVIFLTGEEG